MRGKYYNYTGIPGVTTESQVIENSHISQIKSILKECDRKKPIHYFLTKTIPRFLSKTNLWLSQNLDNLTSTPLNPNGPIPGSLLMEACNLRELWSVHSANAHFHVLDSHQKSMLVKERALFKGFFENECTSSCDSFDIVFFNKSKHGMKTSMNDQKACKIINFLSGNCVVKSRYSKTELSKLCKFCRSFGVVAVKENCSILNCNNILRHCPMLKGKTVWTRSLTSGFFISGGIDFDSLLVLDVLGIMKLDDLQRSVIARRRIGRPRKSNSVFKFMSELNCDRTEKEKVEELTSFLLHNNCKAMLQLFSYQVLRQSGNRQLWNAVIQHLAYDEKGNVNGVCVLYPDAGDFDSNGNAEKSEEILTIQEIAADIFISNSKDHFSPCVFNQNNCAGEEARSSVSHEINDDDAIYCKCGMKALRGLTKSNRNGNRGRHYYNCKKHKNNPTRCDFIEVRDK